jgi:hypothetical protein
MANPQEELQAKYDSAVSFLSDLEQVRDMVNRDSTINPSEQESLQAQLAEMTEFVTTEKEFFQAQLELLKAPPEQEVTLREQLNKAMQKMQDNYVRVEETLTHNIEVKANAEKLVRDNKILAANRASITSGMNYAELYAEFTNNLEEKARVFNADIPDEGVKGKYMDYLAKIKELKGLQQTILDNHILLTSSQYKQRQFAETHPEYFTEYERLDKLILTTMSEFLQKSGNAILVKESGVVSPPTKMLGAINTLIESVKGLITSQTKFVSDLTNNNVNVDQEDLALNAITTQANKIDTINIDTYPTIALTEEKTKDIFNYYIKNLKSQEEKLRNIHSPVVGDLLKFNKYLTDRNGEMDNVVKVEEPAAEKKALYVMEKFANAISSLMKDVNILRINSLSVEKFKQFMNESAIKFKISVATGASVAIKDVDADIRVNILTNLFFIDVTELASLLKSASPTEMISNIIARIDSDTKNYLKVKQSPSTAVVAAQGGTYWGAGPEDDALLSETTERKIQIFNFVEFLVQLARLEEDHLSSINDILNHIATYIMLLLAMGYLDAFLVLKKRYMAPYSTHKLVLHKLLSEVYSRFPTLTYLKVRLDKVANNNFDQKTYNKRFDLKHDCKSLVVRYNDHNFSYYNVIEEKAGAKTVDRAIINKTPIEPFKKYEETFEYKYKNNTLMKQYDYKDPNIQISNKYMKFAEVFERLRNVVNVDVLDKTGKEKKDKWFKYLLRMKDYFTVSNNQTEAQFMAVDKYDHDFLYGPFTRIFPAGPQFDNKFVAERCPEVIINLLNGNNVFIIGYGASGAGKTSTLIFFQNQKQGISEDGILIEICSILGSTFFKKQQEGQAFQVSLQAYEFYEGNKSKEDTNPRDCFGGNKLLFTYQSYAKQGKNAEGFVFTASYKDLDSMKYENYVFENRFYADPTTTFTKKETSLAEVCQHIIDNDRYTKATTNNPNSSRSHVLVMLTFHQIKGSPSLVVGDFAGVENAFMCENNDVLKQFVNIFSSKKTDVVKTPAGDQRIKFYDKYTINEERNKDVERIDFTDVVPFDVTGEKTDISTFIKNEFKKSNVETSVLKKQKEEGEKALRKNVKQMLDAYKQYLKALSKPFVTTISNTKYTINPLANTSSPDGTVNIAAQLRGSTPTPDKGTVPTNLLMDYKTQLSNFVATIEDVSMFEYMDFGIATENASGGSRKKQKGGELIDIENLVMLANLLLKASEKVLDTTALAGRVPKGTTATSSAYGELKAHFYKTKGGEPNEMGIGYFFNQFVTTVTKSKEKVEARLTSSDDGTQVDEVGAPGAATSSQAETASGNAFEKLAKYVEKLKSLEDEFDTKNEDTLDKFVMEFKSRDFMTCHGSSTEPVYVFNQGRFERDMQSVSDFTPFNEDKSKNKPTVNISSINNFFKKYPHFYSMIEHILLEAHGIELERLIKVLGEINPSSLTSAPKPSSYQYSQERFSWEDPNNAKTKLFKYISETFVKCKLPISIETWDEDEEINYIRNYTTKDVSNYYTGDKKVAYQELKFDYKTNYDARIHFFTKGITDSFKMMNDHMKDEKFTFTKDLLLVLFKMADRMHFYMEGDYDYTDWNNLVKAESWLAEGADARRNQDVHGKVKEYLTSQKRDEFFAAVLAHLNDDQPFDKNLKYNVVFKPWGTRLGNWYVNEEFICNLYNENMYKNKFLMKTFGLKSASTFKDLKQEMSKLHKFRQNNAPLFDQTDFDIKSVNALYPVISTVDSQLFLLLSILICKFPRAKSICAVRLAEGNFINETLKDMRTEIKNLLYTKTKDLISPNPPFADVCLKDYCTGNACFVNKATKQQSADIIGKTLIEQLNALHALHKTERAQNNQWFTFSDIVVTIFCVMNISHTASNPPPSPYINITALKKLYYTYLNNKTNFFKNNEKNIREFYELLTELEETVNAMNLNANNDKSYAIRQSTHYQSIMEKRKELAKDYNFWKVQHRLSEIKPEEASATSEAVTQTDINTLMQELEDKDKEFGQHLLDVAGQDDRTLGMFMDTLGYLIEDIEKTNASSTVGTLEFIDALSKYYSTHYNCVIDDGVAKQPPPNMNLMEITDYNLYAQRYDTEFKAVNDEKKTALANVAFAGKPVGRLGMV